MSKRIVHSFTPGQLITVPTYLGYSGPSSKERTTYEFIEYKDEEQRCMLKDLVTEEKSLWCISWIKPLKKVA
jgi:hypothetical protein